MADVNKSVEISYRADIKQLLANLKQMPGITEKQAKEMVTGLNKQLRQAEKAAARAAKTTVKSFDQMGKAANRASINARGLRKDFANIDRLSSEASQALMVFSPAMGEAAAQASTFAGAAESAGRALMVGNPLFLAAAAAAGIAFVAYQSFTERSAELAEQGKKLNKVLKDSAEELEKQEEAAEIARKSFADIVEQTENLRNEIRLLNGEISQAEFERLNVDSEVLKTTQALTKERDNQVNALLMQRSALLDVQRAQQKQFETVRKDRYADNQEKQRLSAETRKTAAEIEAINQKIKDTQSELNEQIRITTEETERLLQEKIKIKEADKAASEAEKRRKEAQKKKDKEENDALKKQKEEQKKLQEIQQLSLETAQKKQQLDNQNFVGMAAIVSKEQEIAAKKKVQIDALDEQIKKAQELAALAKEEATTDEQKQAAQQVELETQELIKELKQAQSLAELEAEKQLQKLREEGSKKALKNSADLRKQELQTAHELFNATSDFANALGDLQQTANKQNKETALRLFRFNQAAAIGDIAFSVAKGIAEAASLPPILRGAQIAAIVATGAAQSASVMAQQPPTADMGMIGNSDPLRPDERMVRVLKGESILDRATTASLGEDGVRALSSGGGMQPQVVVMQPFKHFDRYIQRNQAGGGSLSQASSRIRY